jgi:uncharacterized protein
VQIAVISDTHLPRGDRRLPGDCVARLQSADVIIHAGDLIRLPVLRELESYAPVIAVHGNVDDADVRAALPAVASLETGGATIAVLHDAGPAKGRLARMRRRFPEADAVIFGHSHLPLLERAPDGFQIFNPGSPTERRRAPAHTMGAVSVEDRRLLFQLIALD